MFKASANLNLMIKAARNAARGLLRDFGEVENLQVTSKSLGDFVTKADIKANMFEFRTGDTRAIVNQGLALTVILGIYFTMLQGLEYYEARFR